MLITKEDYLYSSLDEQPYYTKRIKSLFLGHWKIEETGGNSHHASYVCTLSPPRSKNIETSVLFKQTHDSSIH